MNLWSDIMISLIESIKSDPIIYYIGLLIGLVLLAIVIALIVKNDRNKKELIKEKQEEKARIEKHVDLESMIAKMQEQEQTKLKDTDPVANFEQEQEEKAIISYQELVNAVKNENKEPINVTIVSSTGDVLSTTSIPRETIAEDKPIFIDEIKLPKPDMEFEAQEETIVEPKVSPKPIIPENNGTKEQFNDNVSAIKSFESIFANPAVKDEPKPSTPLPEVDELKSVKPLMESKEQKEFHKFKNSEFISPIYGRQNSNISYPKISTFKLEDDNSVINISDDNDPNTEFLKTLKDYRNK